jgi:hypothetical protein
MRIATKRAPHETVREWTIALGVLTGGGHVTAKDAEMKLAAYVPLLTDNFPTAAFTQASLHHVAAQCKFFPAYAEVVTNLRAWWRDNRPIANALPPPTQRYAEPERQPPTDDERAYVRQRVAEITAHLQANDADRTLSPSRDPGPRHLSPAQLDVVNPLPNGAKRLTGASR